MADNEDPIPQPPKRKGKKKLIFFVVLPLLLAGLGGGGFYAWKAGLLNAAGASAATAEASGPQLVPKAQEKRASLGKDDKGESEGSGHGGGSKSVPGAMGGDKYASSYYPLEKEFTSNLQDSVHFIQVGIAISTPYDDTVLENIKTHEIAIRSAVLMALGETSEEQVFTAEGKAQIQKRLVDAINGVLKEKEGFGGVSNVYFTNFIVQ